MADQEGCFSVGPPNGSVGNFKCLEVEGNNLGEFPGGGPEAVDMITSDCSAGPSEQVQFVGRTIYTESAQRCMSLQPPVSTDAAEAAQILSGIPVSGVCPTTQLDPSLLHFFQFSYLEGQIVNSAVCLDATGGVLAFNTCDPSNDGQQWQIK